MSPGGLPIGLCAIRCPRRRRRVAPNAGQQDRSHLVSASRRKQNHRTKVTGKLDRGDFIVEKIAFESLPGIYVTANLYIPRNRTGRLPAIIYVCGHAYSPQGAKTAYQRHGISFAKNGYVALIVDPIQIAETFGIHHGIRNQALEEWYARGYTPAGPEVWNAMHVGHTVDSVRLWDVMRAAQALAAQEGVIPERIMAVGRGVSGVLGLYAAILGAPIEQVMLIDPPSSHVEGPYFLNVLRHMDLPEAAALLAPKRLNFYARIPAAFAKTHTVYELYGKPEHLWLGMSLRAPLMNRFDHGFASGY